METPTTIVSQLIRKTRSESIKLTYLPLPLLGTGLPPRTAAGLGSVVEAGP